MDGPEAAPTIITCVCGAKVRLPATATGRSFRCPKCKAEFATTADSQVIASYKIPADHAQCLCPICQSAIQPQEEAIDCPGCGQVHHRECWVEVGGCSTYGCPQVPVLEKESPEQATTAWGDTKICPVCGEKIKSIATVCRFCKSRFDTSDPVSLRDVVGRSRKIEGQRTLQNTVIGLFAVTVIIGILAPLMLIVDLAWVLSKKRQLKSAGPIYLVLGYSAIGVAALYSLLILLFAMSGAFR